MNICYVRYVRRYCYDMYVTYETYHMIHNIALFVKKQVPPRLSEAGPEVLRVMSSFLLEAVFTVVGIRWGPLGLLILFQNLEEVMFVLLLPCFVYR